MKFAIVHDGLATPGGRGGAEAVLAHLHGMFPDAPIYTTVYHPDRMPEEFRAFDIRPSFIQCLPFGASKFRAYLPFMPTAVEQFDLSEFDVVLSCSHSVAKGVITAPQTRHLCYCYSPLRYAWDMYHEYMETSWHSRAARLLIPPLLTYMRMWDTLSSQRVDTFIAISRFVAQRIKKYYRRDALVVYPPVEMANFSLSERLEPYFLIVSRLEPYKRVDVAVEAFNRLGLPLLIIGDGAEREKLANAAKSNITFLGRQPDSIVREHLSKCQALIFPGEEDFGITPVEAQASGRPVIAYRGGGALETVSEQISGRFFFPKTADALVNVVKQFDAGQFEPAAIRRHAAQFDLPLFQARMRQTIELALCSPARVLNPGRA